MRTKPTRNVLRDIAHSQTVYSQPMKPHAAVDAAVGLLLSAIAV